MAKEPGRSLDGHSLAYDNLERFSDAPKVLGAQRTLRGRFQSLFSVLIELWLRVQLSKIAVLFIHRVALVAQSW